MAWLPEGEKVWKICLFVLTECTNVTNTQTDRQTPHDGIDRACIASRGKTGSCDHEQEHFGDTYSWMVSTCQLPRSTCVPNLKCLTLCYPELGGVPN